MKINRSSKLVPGKPSMAQLRAFVGNPDAYAVQHDDGSWHPVRVAGWGVRPGPSGFDTVLQDHLNMNHTVGTYVLHGDQARTLVFDFDDGENMQAQAEDVKAELVRLGIPERGIGIEFSGRKGYHVWVVFADYVEAHFLRRIGRTVLAVTGLQCEVFPKQDSARDLGNLVKLPGGKHQVSGKANNFIDQVPKPITTQVLDRVLADLPPEPERAKSNYEGPDDALTCLTNIAAGVAEGGRNHALYHYAVLLRGSHRVPDEAVELLVRDAAAKCDPPYDEPLEGLLESSRTGGPICEQLPESIKCDPEECVKCVFKGLHTRKGQLRHAAKGQGVVMEVEDRTEGRVKLAHPDMGAGGTVSVKR